jgi:hypothetical protein
MSLTPLSPAKDCDAMPLSGEYLKKYGMILAAEESFARLVALGLWVKRPLTPWHYLIPGMFIFDILRRNQAVSRYSAVFIFPRKTALDTALDVIRGEDRESRISRAEEKTREWLESLGLDSDSLHHAHRGQTSILVDHYSRLLQSEGSTYFSLLRGGYVTRLDYQAYLQRLGEAEQEVDRAVAEAHGRTPEIWARLRAEQAQVEDLRRKDMEKAFLEDR